MKTLSFISMGFLVVSLLAGLCGCTKNTPAVQQGSYDDPRAIITRIDVPIVSIDGRPSPKPMHEISLDPGHHVLAVEYPTLLALYHCTFEVVLEAGQTYEIIQRFDRYPVFLNRIKQNRVFTTRLEKFPPRECTKIEKNGGS